MNRNEDFKEYPKILKIENDGKVIALDRQGRINTDFNTNNINDESFYNVFGKRFGDLHRRYVDENLSRLDKNKNDYQEDAQQSQPTKPQDYYNERDYKRDLEQQNEIEKSKRKNKWLWGLLIVAILIIAFFVIKGQLSNNNEQDDQASKENEQLQQEIKDTKSDLKDSKQDNQDTQQRINNLQNKVDNMKNNNEDNNNTQDLQEGVKQLQSAQNSKINGNEEEMKDKLSKIDNVIDTEKLSEQGKNQWEKFKNWMSEQF